jgi:CheY-like chemotaxis protein
LSFTDHGIGMPRDVVARVFDPFFTTKSKGHGLGLTTSYSIVNRHGGCINVESTPGEGSTFRVYLPAAKGSTSGAPAEPRLLHQGRGLFLLMDDEEVVREALGRMLSAFGYQVDATANGKHALESLQKHLSAGQAVAGMVLDLTVPGGMGGEEAIAPIRKLAPSLPVFVASGYADDPVMADPRAYGFTASISKPFTRTELSKMLSLHIKTG